MAKQQKRYGMLINLNKCIGCYACQVTCKAEYNIPFGTFRCRVETYQSGSYPDIRKFFLPRLCNHCDIAPCIEECKEKALYKNQDGVVVLNSSNCIGCKMCIKKCPYNAIEINPVTGKSEKCDFCYERTAKELLPVCVQSCMGKAILFGDINDPKSAISLELAKHQLKVLNPEFGTRPSIFYISRDDTGSSALKDHVITTGPSTRRIKVKQPPEPLLNNTKLVYTSDAMCPSECGISVAVENGIAKKIYGNPHTLINNGTFCAKGASGLQFTYSPHRIKTPLMRIGERGEDKWKEITWEEASDQIAKKLISIKHKYGPESVFLDCGDVTDREAFYRLFHAFGTPNTYNHGSICDPNRRWGYGIMTGDERLLPDVQRPVLMRNDDGEMYLKRAHDAKLILNIGANPFVATRYNYMSNGIAAAKEENGCLYIVIDPAYTNSAAKADIWLSIIPGSDAALLAGMLFYIIMNDSEQKYIAHDFIKNYTGHWEEFKDTFLSYSKSADPSNGLHFFTTEWASEKTGISAENIMKISHLFGSTKPASIEVGMHGTSHHTNGDITSILSTTLCIITGNVEVPGGLVFTESLKPKRGTGTIGKAFLDKVVSRTINDVNIEGKLYELHKDLYGDFPAAWKGVLTDLPQKIRNGIKLNHGPFKDHYYPVKAFITRAGNPVITAGSTPDWIDAVTAKNNPLLPHFNNDVTEELLNEYQLELMVFIDTHITDTGKFADIVLPEAGFLERMGVSDVYTMSPEIAIRDQVIKPLYESKTPFEIMMTISDALIKNGDQDIRAEDFSHTYRNEEDFINEILSETPGIHNIGNPLPYPDLPEGCLLVGTPDNPTAVWGKNIIKHGELLTVDWLRKNNGVAIWPASYHRYKRSDGSPSGIYPKTGSKKFEFKFSYLEDINNKFGTDFPVTFYWNDCKWNPKNSLFKELSKEYPFQLISGRVHYAMTMTTICQYLAETETECMKRLNDAFTYTMCRGGFETRPYERHKESGGFYGLPQNQDIHFASGTVSIPVFAINKTDGERLNLRTGNIVILETPFKKRVKGKAFLTEEIMPGVIKTAFGPGGQKASGLGFQNNLSEYTPNINECCDPENISPFTGMPGFGDIMVKILKESS